MLTALVVFCIAAIIIAAVAYVLILLWDWVCGLLQPPAPIVAIVRVLIIVVAVVAILYQLVPLVARV
jgi:hypothetical protein